MHDCFLVGAVRVNNFRDTVRVHAEHGRRAVNAVSNSDTPAHIHLDYKPAFWSIHPRVPFDWLPALTRRYQTGLDEVLRKRIDNREW